MGKLQQKYGIFWLPENETQRIPGYIEARFGEQISLTLFGVFSGGNFVPETNVKRIYGYLENSEKVTLDDCILTEVPSLLFEDRLNISKCLVRTLYEGIFLKDELFYNEFKFHIEGLEDWVNINGFEINTNLEKIKINVNYNIPENIEVLKIDDFIISITFAVKPPSWYAVQTNSLIKQDIYFCIRSNYKTNIKEFINLAYKINQFMCFSMNQLVGITEVFIKSEDYKFLVGSEEYSQRIKFFYPTLPHQNNRTYFNDRNFLFDYKKIKNNIGEYFKKWLNSYLILSPPIELYFSYKFSESNDFNFKFLTLAQGLESYHRRKEPKSTYLPVSEFNKMRNEIIQNCPKDYQEWLLQKLNFANEITLKKRLVSLLNTLPHGLIPKDRNEALVKQIKNTRNYLTHYDERLLKKAVQGTDLVYLCLKMEGIFKLLFLQKIGFSDSEVIEIINKNSLLKTIFSSH